MTPLAGYHSLIPRPISAFGTEKKWTEHKWERRREKEKEARSQIQLQPALARDAFYHHRSSEHAGLRSSPLWDWRTQQEREFRIVCVPVIGAMSKCVRVVRERAWTKLFFPGNYECDLARPLFSVSERMHTILRLTDKELMREMGCMNSLILSLSLILSATYFSGECRDELPYMRTMNEKRLRVTQAEHPCLIFLAVIRTLMRVFSCNDLFDHRLSWLQKHIFSTCSALVCSITIYHIRHNEQNFHFLAYKIVLIL